MAVRVGLARQDRSGAHAGQGSPRQNSRRQMPRRRPGLYRPFPIERSPIRATGGPQSGLVPGVPQTVVESYEVSNAGGADNAIKVAVGKNETSFTRAASSAPSQAYPHRTRRSVPASESPA